MVIVIMQLIIYVLSCCAVNSLADDKTYLTSIERAIEVPITELDNNIVKYLTQEVPPINSNVQLVAHMNIMFFRALIDYFNYLDYVGELLIKGDIDAFRLLKEIGVDGPRFLKVKMDRKAWDDIAKSYDYEEGEIDEMIANLGAIKLLWENMQPQLQVHLDKEKSQKKTK